MGWHARSRSTGAPRWLAIAIAAVALLLTPVEYRAGADYAHPHAMLQLIYEASQGVPLHHHAVNYDETDAPASQDAHSSMAPGTVSNIQMMNHTLVVGSDVARQADVSLAVIVKMFAALLPVAMALPIGVIMLVRRLQDGPALHGICPAPEPPPPRL